MHISSASRVAVSRAFPALELTVSVSRVVRTQDVPVPGSRADSVCVPSGQDVPGAGAQRGPSWHRVPGDGGRAAGAPAGRHARRPAAGRRPDQQRHGPTPRRLPAHPAAEGD